MSLRRPLILLILALQLALPIGVAAAPADFLPSGPALVAPDGSCQGSSQCGG